MRLDADPSDPFEAIVRILVPYLGESMARAALGVNRQKLGLDGSTLLPDDAERLLVQLTPGLHVFVGHDKTARILEQIRSALRGARGGSGR